MHKVQYDRGEFHIAAILSGLLSPQEIHSHSQLIARLTRALLELHRRCLFAEPGLLLLLLLPAALVDAHDLGRGLFDAVPVVDCGLALLLRLVDQLLDVVGNVGHVRVCALEGLKTVTI